MMEKRIVKNTFINYVYFIFSGMIPFVLTPIIINRIGNEQYGIYVFLGIFSIGGYISLMELGFQGTAVKYIAEYYATSSYDKINKVINTVFCLFMLCGIISCMIILFVNIFLFEHIFNVPPAYLTKVKRLICLMALSMIYQFPSLGFAAILEGMQRYDLLRLGSFITICLNAVLVIVFLTNNNGIMFLIIVSLSVLLLNMFIYYILAKYLLPNIKINIFRYDIEVFKNMANFSAKLFLSRIIGLVFNQTHKILIGIFLTMTLMTYYDITNKIHIIILSIMSIANSAIVPLASQLSAMNDSERLKKLFFEGTRFAVHLTLPSLIFCMVFPEIYLKLWLGENFVGLSNLVRLYLSHCFLTVLTGVAGTMFVGMNRLNDILKVSSIMALANLLISIATVKILGITGLILGTVLSYIVGQIVLLLIVNRVFNENVFNFVKEVVLLPYILGGILAALSVFLRAVLEFNGIMQLAAVWIFLYIAYVTLYYLIKPKDIKYLIKEFKTAAVS